MTKERPPMLTKPAGVFLQLLGAVAIIVGIAMLASDSKGLGVVATLIGVGLLWFGRQTGPRQT